MKIHISKAARAFGCLQKSIFQERHLSVEAKRRVYEAAVLSVLLYGADTWSIKAESVRRLSGSITAVFEPSWESPSSGSGGNTYPQGS